MTIGCTTYGFLYTVSLNQPSIAHGYQGIEPQRYSGHDLDIRGGSLGGEVVKQQWGNRKRRFSGLSDSTSSAP